MHESSCQSKEQVLVIWNWSSSEPCGPWASCSRTDHTLEEHDGKVSIGGRNITNLRFADNKDALAEEEQELEALLESLDQTCTRYKMEINA